MTNRKKRLAKGIGSLQKQIDLHEQKKLLAEEEGLLELRDYYEREIIVKKEAKKHKETLLDKQ